MKHCKIVVSIIAFFSLHSNYGMSNSAIQNFKQLTTDESTLNWMELKKEKTVTDFLDEVKIIFNLDEFSEFKILKTETDKLGWTNYRIQQYYNGIPIEGAKYILHEKDDYVKKANGKLIADFTKAKEKPLINKENSTTGLLKQIKAKTYIWEDTEFENSLKAQKQDLYATNYPTPILVYMSPKFDQSFENYRLAYKMEVSSLEPFESYIYYVDAHNGEIIHKITNILHCNVGTGQTNYSGTVNISTDSHNGQFRLHNYCLDGGGEGIITKHRPNRFGDGVDITNSTNTWTTNKNGIEAFWATELFYNYMRQYHGQISTDGNGELLNVNVNVNLKYPSSCSANSCWAAFYWQNQAWFSDATLSYGAPVALDIVAHEFTHGLTYKTANLLYQNESGALNESFSDIFGVVVERVMGDNQNGLDWLVGEDARALRDMSNPNLYGDPDTYLGDNWYELNGCSPWFGNDYCGVHTNSGVQNYWFYLLAEGGSGINDQEQNFNVTGIGIVDAAKVAYRNLTQYLTDNSDYADAENGSIQAAIDLFGANSNKVQQVRNAWCAVGGGCSNKSITLTSPNGNEVFFGNKTEQITWTSLNIQSSGNIIIEFSLNDGGNWEPLAVVPNTGSYSWLVPSVQTAMATVRVTLDGDFSVRDQSNGLFKILSCTLNSGFSISTTNPERCVNNTIMFSNETSDINNPNLNGVSYKWKVDGVQESTAFNFQKVFTSSDTYNINLEVNDASGCSSSYSYPIYIRPDSDADFIWDQLDNSYSANFIANQPDAITYSWTYNGQTIRTSKTITYNFNTQGNYQVCLSTNSSCGPSNTCKTITIVSPMDCPNANFTVNDNQFCAGNITSFSNTSESGATTFEWYVNGIYKSSASTFFYSFPAAGEYTILLKAFNSSGNCENEKCVDITVNPSSTELRQIPNYMNCSFSSTSLNADIDDVQSYQWRLNGVVKGNGKTLTTFESGIYQLTVTDYCGQSTRKQVLVALNDQDCIRPGDLNYDGKVNSDDIIYFGLHYGNCGFPREEQGINWSNYSGLDWGSAVFNNPDVDIKHVDANGNGCVDLADWDALRVNWLKEHNNSNNLTIEPVPAMTGFNLHLSPNEATTQNAAGDVYLVLDLNVETDQGYDLPLYAGYATYDLDDIEQIGSISGIPFFSIEDNVSWLTDGSIDFVSYQYLDPIENEFRIAFTLLDQKNKVNNGRIGQIGVEIINVGPGAAEPEEFVLEPVELAFFNASGEELPLGQSASAISSAVWQGYDCRSDNISVNNNNNTIDYKSYYTTGTITTNGDVDMVNQSNITYSANRVRLNSGFKARPNSNFKVRYGCNPLLNKEGAEEIEIIEQNDIHQNDSSINTQLYTEQNTQNEATIREVKTPKIPNETPETPKAPEIERPVLNILPQKD